jgi:hypothetical protein
MEGKSKRIKFSGRGLFSSINVFTTRLAMIDAIETYGLGETAYAVIGRTVGRSI